MWLKELLLHKGSVKMDEYYGMSWALYYWRGVQGPATKAPGGVQGAAPPEALGF